MTFNYETKSWRSAKYKLPAYKGDYVLLTPKDILTKDDTWINKADLFNEFDNILETVTNAELRSQLNVYFSQNLPKPELRQDGTEKEPKKNEVAKS